ncbi:MAG: type 2 isopentenyl-diphosphate Delta-isomerase [Deltaproteobacteria bacterium]|nr:MAG: type 2 isopentenyl-diphosphate Delta-isomerase [Deltaproteobacteria bacterium]
MPRWCGARTRSAPRSRRGRAVEQAAIRRIRASNSRQSDAATGFSCGAFARRCYSTLRCTSIRAGGTLEDEGITVRKAEHLRLAIEEDVEVPLGGGGAFDAVRLVYQALPEIDLDAIDPSVELFGKRLAFPLMIGSMTGGTEEAGVINRRLAEAAARCGVGMFLGSQRVMIERPETVATFAVRDVAPEIPLVANIGAVQLNYGVTPAHIRGIAEQVGADAVVFHLNAAQEAVQDGGDTRFAGLAQRLADATAELGASGLPCGVKEVGSGFSIDAVRRLAGMQLAFIESAGRGGTSWTLIEGRRAGSAGGRSLGALFADWGVPSVTSLLACVAHGGGIPVIASGGLRSGLDAARAIAAGASVTAMALPLLRAAARSVDAVVAELEAFKRALVTAMFLVGAPDIAALRRAPIRIDHRARPEVWEGRVDDPRDGMGRRS